MIVSRAKDSSFMVLAHTKIITNAVFPNIAGTVFSGFFLQTNVSRTSIPIQIELDDSNLAALDIGFRFL